MADIAPPRRPSRSAWRILGWIAGLLVGLPVALVLLVLAVVLVGANSGPGRRLIERQAASLTGGLVQLHGLGGRFPDALTASRIDIDDSEGPWLSIDHLTLDWSPLRLLSRTAHVERALADRIVVSRRPGRARRAACISAS
jgi:translocation and assembly module TamB